MSERLGAYDPRVEALIAEVKSFREPVAQTLSDAKSQREKERIENGETTHPEETKAAKKVKHQQVQRTDGTKESSARRR